MEVSSVTLSYSLTPAAYTFFCGLWCTHSPFIFSLCYPQFLQELKQELSTGWCFSVTWYYFYVSKESGYISLNNTKQNCIMVCLYMGYRHVAPASSFGVRQTDIWQAGEGSRGGAWRPVSVCVHMCLEWSGGNTECTSEKLSLAYSIHSLLHLINQTWQCGVSWWEGRI